MKNRRSSLARLSSRERAKKRDKDRAVRELKRLVEATGVSYSGARFAEISDGSRKMRVSPKRLRDEESICGIFRGSRRGFGFVEREAERDIFIPEDKTAGAIDGDTVEAVFHTYTDKFGEERTEGRIVKIVEFGARTVIGTLRHIRRGFGRKSMFVYVLEPNNPRMSEYIEVDNTGDAYDGDIVEAKLRRHGGFVYAEVIKSFGDAENFGANYEAVLSQFGIETEFSPEALAISEEAARAPVCKEGRLDLRRHTIFTIDGAGAKDLDDAISLKKLGGGWELGVHIADVSYYVKEKNALDRAATSRGTSVYFTDKVVPMLPPALSNGACSLNAGEDKYAISALITLDGEGKIVKTELHQSIIRSCVRGVYSEVNEIFAGSASEAILKKYEKVIPSLKRMHELYLKLLDNSRKRGAMELEGNEAYIALDENGMPTEIIRTERGDGERLIEQFMLTANEAVATKLSELKIPCVYRVHDEPPEDKLDSLILFLSNLGFDTRGIRVGDGVSLTALSAILDKARERGIEKQTSYAVLRAMSKAKYSEIHSPHFGLSIPLYCHFTSPIRRLSDLATHRIIRRVLFEGKAAAPYGAYAKRAAAAASDAELRALGAERKIEDMYKALYLSAHVGEEFDATVSSVTSFGMFCELDNTCEGLIPISDMGEEFFFDEKNLSLRSKTRIFKLADRLRIRVEECNVNEGKVRFSLI